MLARITALALVLADAPVPPPIEVPPQPVLPRPPLLEPGDAPAPEPPSDEGEPAPGDAPGDGDVPEPGDAPSDGGEPAPDDTPDDEGEPSDDEAPEDADPFGDHADEEPFPDEGEDGDTEPLPDYDPLRDSPQALRARHWVRTGIGTLAAGGALLVGAIIMGASDPCNLQFGNSCQPAARNRAALVMGIPAAVLVGGGAAMLGVGLARKRRLALDLQAGRSSVGILVRGRF